MSFSRNPNPAVPTGTEFFNSAQVSTLYCPSLYLSPGEISNYGDCAYIYRTSTTHAGETYTAYVALYFSSDVFASIMDNGITVNDSVSYIINERNATVSTTNAKLSGMYYQYYDNLKDYLMSRTAFWKRKLSAEKCISPSITSRKPTGSWLP